MLFLLFLFFICGVCESFLIKDGIRDFNKSSVGFGSVPDYFDWRELDMVSPVKDQRHCAACWAFSIIGALESHLKIHLKKEEVLSEQFLIDCDPDSHGCNDGSILDAYGNIVNKLGGVLRSKDYRTYIEQKAECQWSPSDGVRPIPVVGFRRVQHDEDIMANYVYNYGPLSVAINSASMTRQRKPTDIDEPSEQDCPPDQLNHAVLIVGYNAYVGADNHVVPYWIIKNSWGKEWGDHGFYYLVRGRNACGIASDVSFPFVE